jgi:hypothetical protein
MLFEMHYQNQFSKFFICAIKFKPPKKFQVFGLGIFLSVAKAMVYHHALAYIKNFRNDDIQCSVILQTIVYKEFKRWAILQKVVEIGDSIHIS